jgi:thioredoxin-related protein
MRKIAMLLCLFIPVMASAQMNEEIRFRTFPSWEKVLEQAKNENKTIFIDAYATWCGPCKMMDADVYTNLKIANYVNEGFIPIKIQFDQTDKDNEDIRNWYEEAKALQKKFRIDAFPTFLFISPAGELIYKGIGYQDTTNFMTLVKNANNPTENYSAKISKYKRGQLKEKKLLLLSLQAKQYHDDSLAFEIASKYKKTIIDHAPPAELLSPDLLSYFVSFGKLININDPIARYLYNNPDKADSLFGTKGSAQKMTDYFIGKDILNPVLLKDGKITSEMPDWATLEKKVSKDFGEVRAEKLLIGYKAEWYRSKGDWENYVKSSIEKQEMSVVDTSEFGLAMLNNFVYNNILKHSNNPIYLNKGLAYMKLVIAQDSSAEVLDTYAVLLYKLGRKPEALLHERRALDISEKANNLNRAKLFKETIRKMEIGLPLQMK